MGAGVSGTGTGGVVQQTGGVKGREDKKMGYVGVLAGAAGVLFV